MSNLFNYTETKDHLLLIGQATVEALLTNREWEARTLRELNDRLEKSLEAISRDNGDTRDLEILKNELIEQLSLVRKEFEEKFTGQEAHIVELANERGRLELEHFRLDALLNELYRRLEVLKKIKSNDSSLFESLIREVKELTDRNNEASQQIDIVNSDLTRLGIRKTELTGEYNRLKTDYNDRAGKRIRIKNEADALEKKFSFMEKRYTTETAIYERKYSQSVVKNSERFERELAAAIEAIIDEIDKLFDKNEKDLDGWFAERITHLEQFQSKYYEEEKTRLIILETNAIKYGDEVRRRNDGLRLEISQLKESLKTVQSENEGALLRLKQEQDGIYAQTRQLQTNLKRLLEFNQSLYAEIAIYREMLKCRMADKWMVAKAQPIIQERLQERLKVNIQEVDTEGHYIKLKNVSSDKKDIVMTGWVLQKTVSEGATVSYTFGTFTLPYGKSVTIWAGAEGEDFITGDLVCKLFGSWGLGTNYSIVLLNALREEVASDYRSNKAKTVIVERVVEKTVTQQK